jgi:hypothetical protein
MAEDDAQWAEADAYDAVAFAESANEEAKYAVLDGCDGEEARGRDGGRDLRQAA